MANQSRINQMIVQLEGWDDQDLNELISVLSQVVESRQRGFSNKPHSFTRRSIRDTCIDIQAAS